MSAPRRIPQVASRGVYHLPFYGSLGEVWVVAVDRHGRKVSEAIVLEGQSMPHAEGLLRDLLDRVDPVDVRDGPRPSRPQLRVVQ